jgi:hypothetical protein
MSAIPGNEFRDVIRDFLRSAGCDAETEVLLAGKKVDVLASRRAFGGTERIAIEAKDFAAPLTTRNFRPVAQTRSIIGRARAIARIRDQGRFRLDGAGDRHADEGRCFA